MADIDKLAGFVPRPYQKERVLNAARELRQPFLLREAVAATRLPKFVVHRVLQRCVKQRILTRRRVAMTYPGFTGKGSCPPRWIAGGRTRRVWAYSFVSGC